MIWLHSPNDENSGSPWHMYFGCGIIHPYVIIDLNTLKNRPKFSPNRWSVGNEYI